MVLDIMGRKVLAATGVPKVTSFANPVAERDPYLSMIVGYAIVFLAHLLKVTVVDDNRLIGFHNVTLLAEKLLHRDFFNLFHVGTRQERG
jgi:hypothetical protein